VRACSAISPPTQANVAHAPHGLADRAVAGLLGIGPGLAVAGDADHDQPRVDGRERIEAEPPLLHRAGPEILDQDVGLRDELLDQVLAGRLAGVDLDRLLVAGDDRPPQRLAVRLLAAPFPHRVAGARLLDLDHLGTEIGEQLAAERTGEQLAHLDHPQVRQGWRGGRVYGLDHRAFLLFVRA
jgi:hypothetical protein